MIQSPFSNGGSPTPDNQATETRFTYFPTTVVTNADQVTSQGDVSGTSAALGQVTAAGGESCLQWCALCSIIQIKQAIKICTSNCSATGGNKRKVECNLISCNCISLVQKGKYIFSNKQMLNILILY